ncbi:hypothetical protein [Pseudorhodoferax sp. Leaf274]|uniref:hypothetical protein n=1 Tax=Pseudorhodoferax sp. Leaf274 TaxID=1736318 RepID=UPI0007039281|nr:hypothetical protein [Pseudorhodoferax sp. Leaf274]KQP37385.1 hypothetical protein ASF44_13570 [Pseudorhodoferax sp. Leaf274]
MSTTPIDGALAGERVIGLSPQSATEAATDWRRRPNVFPGRALTAGALTQWQAWQAGHLALRGQDWTAGVVDGLELSVRLLPDSTGFEAVELEIGRGLALATSGEDLVLQQPLRCRLADVPVVAPAGFFEDGSGVGAGTEGDPPTLRSRGIGAALGALGAPATPGGVPRPEIPAALPPIGVLVLQPVVADRASLDPMDPCERSACDEGTYGDAAAFEDWRMADGARLLWFVWPGEWRGVPAVPAVQLRNALAWTVFQAEEALPAGQVLPWEAWGQPLALVALDGATRAPLWLDRASVVRRGGQARDARLVAMAGRLQADSRRPALWQARIEQLAEQVASSGEPAPAPGTLNDAFGRFLPPVGLLPRNAFDPAGPRSAFFPVGFDIDAAPIPVEQLDLAVRASAALAPLAVGAAESVRLLVPVPLSSWEPGLLQRARIDPLFQQTLDAHLLRRARTLGLRQGLRQQAAMLDHALSGKVQTVASFKDDPLAVETESLAPWGEPPPGGGHRSALRAGLHQHFFDGAAPPFTVQPNEALFCWVCLDPDNPPRTLMLRWHGPNGWEHRAYWGENLIAGGADGTAARLRVGDLPTPGQWVMLTVAASALGLAGQNVDGMAFALYDGLAAFGLTGARTAEVWRKWFCNFLPTGARVQGDEPWDLLSANDLWAPFEPQRGVEPSLPDLQAEAGDGGIFGQPGTGTGTGTPAARRLGVPTSGFSLVYPPATGWRGHSVVHNAPATNGQGGLASIAIGAGDSFSCWIYLDELNPPRSLWAGLMLLDLRPDPPAASRIQYAFGYWGENRQAELMRTVPGLETLNARTQRAGALPRSGGWVELPLRLPTAAELPNGASRYAALGMVLTAYQGQFAVSDLLHRPPPSATQPTPAPVLLWPTAISADPRPTTVPPYAPFLAPAPIPQHNLGVLTPTPSSRIGTVSLYTELVGDPLLLRLSGHEQSQLLLRGLQGFADYLRQRIDRADDITDFGFAHMQVDMHRIRQLTMSATDAGRLAISPTLAALAKSDSAIEVQKEIGAYIDRVRQTATAASTPPAPPAPPPAPAPGPVPQRPGVSRLAANIGSISAVRIGTITGASSGSLLAASALAVRPGQAAQQANLGSSTNLAARAGVASVAAASRLAEGVLVQRPTAPLNIVYANPVVGLSEVRTTALAERLRNPPSPEARNYALSNRARTVTSLLNLLEAFAAEDSGEVPALLQDFQVPGLAGDPFLAGLPATTPPTLQRPLADFRGNTALQEALARPPTGSDNALDEATLFTQAVSLSDNTIAMLRRLEARLTVYRDALSRCETALATLRGQIGALDARQAEVASQLAEARHDVSVTRALLDEETERIAAINARRAKVLAEEVKFIAYVRPRETDNLLATPTHAVDPGLVEAPVPACLRAHPEPPEELLDMLRVVREAPAPWFVQVPPLLQRLDKVDHLMRLLDGAQVRALAGLAQPRLSTQVVSGASRLATGIAQLATRQTEALAPRVATLQTMNLNLLTSLSWQGVRDQAAQVVSFGDLAEGGHGRADVARAAAEELDRIRGVAACLHAEFSGVLPAIRLQWAELLSEFDAAPNLRNLANLPRWAEIPYLDRRQMQAYADWLFGQIEPGQPQAVALVNDVVRMCLLLASHAPVDRIVQGRMARPTPGVSPGVRIPLTVLDAAPLRVGMAALLYRADQLVARATVEDLGQGEVMARVVHTAQTRVDLGDDVRVHFDMATNVSLAATTARRTLFR